MQHPITFSSLLVLICALSVCASVREQIVSRPNLQDNVVFNRDGLAKLDQLELRIRPTNGLSIGHGVNWVGIDNITRFSRAYLFSPYYSSESESSKVVKPFIVEMFVKTGKDISISIQKFHLISADGVAHKPSHYYSPLIVGSPANYSLNLCKPNSQVQNNSTTLIQIKRDQIVCFAIAYDVTLPLPGENFGIEMNGLTDKDGEIKLRPLLFLLSKETYYHP